jgi:peptidyl-dipeptidase Dcp
VKKNQNMKRVTTIIIFWFLMAGSQIAAQNPLLEPYETPYGIIPFEEVKLEHILPAFNTVLDEARQEIQKIINNPQPATFENTIDAFERLGQKRFLIARYVSLMGHTYSNPELNSIVSEVNQLNSAYFSEVLFNAKLFERVKSVYVKRDNLQLTQEEKTLLENNYSWFARNGNDLPDTQKGRLKEIRTRLSELSVIFRQNVTQDRDRTFFHLLNEEDLTGLPDEAIAAAAEYAGKKGVEGWAFSYHGNLAGQFMTYSENRGLREKLFRESMQIANNDNEFNNLNNAKEILNLRLEMAQLLGYDSYSHYELEETMAETPKQVEDFLNQYRDKVKPIAEREIESVRTFASSFGFDDVIQEWDYSFYNKKYKVGKYEFNTDEVKPFLPVDHVVKESFTMLKDMWGLELRVNDRLPKFHPDATSYEIFDAKGNIKAVMYLDLFEREGKDGGARMSTIRLQHRENGENEIPVLNLLCNFSNPVGDAAALLKLYDLETFLHELGHGLHVILSDVTYRSLSGVNLRYSDFIEMPSMLLQKWTYEPEFLVRVGKHYQTGQPIPQDLIDKIVKNQQEGRSLSAARFMIPDAALDIALHSIQNPFQGDLCEWEANFMKDYSFLPLVKGSCFIPSFNSIFSSGYASGFYTYDWSDMMSWDIFNEFRKNGIFDPATAARLEKEILSKGGAAHPRELFKNFMGRDMSIKAFLESFDE